MTGTYREQLRRAAATNDAAFAEYVSDLEFPEHLRAVSRFADRSERGLFLAPRGHAKTTLFLHRAARRIGATLGRQRLGILTAVDADAESRSRAIRGARRGPALRRGVPLGSGRSRRPAMDGCGLDRPRRLARQGPHLHRDEPGIGARRTPPR